MHNQILPRAISIANRAHRYQTRKFSGLPYIVHPLEVMSILERYGVTDEKVLAAAVLHDVIEDCHEIFENDIRELSTDVHVMVRALTKSPSESETNKKLIEGGFNVQLIKTADIASNTREPILGINYLRKKLNQLHMFDEVIGHELHSNTIASIILTLEKTGYYQ